MNQITNYIIEEKEFDAACPEEKIMNSRQEALLEPIVEELGFELVDVRIL